MTEQETDFVVKVFMVRTVARGLGLKEFSVSEPISLCFKHTSNSEK